MCKKSPRHPQPDPPPQCALYCTATRVAHGGAWRHGKRAALSAPARLPPLTRRPSTATRRSQPCSARPVRPASEPHRALASRAPACDRLPARTSRTRSAVGATSSGRITMRQLVFGGLPFVVHVAWIARPDACAPTGPCEPPGPAAPGRPVLPGALGSGPAPRRADQRQRREGRRRRRRGSTTRFSRPRMSGEAHRRSTCRAGADLASAHESRGRELRRVGAGRPRSRPEGDGGGRMVMLVTGTKTTGPRVSTTTSPRSPGCSVALWALAPAGSASSASTDDGKALNMLDLRKTSSTAAGASGTRSGCRMCASSSSPSTSRGPGREK